MANNILLGFYAHGWFPACVMQAGRGFAHHDQLPTRRAGWVCLIMGIIVCLKTLRIMACVWGINSRFMLASGSASPAYRKGRLTMTRCLVNDALFLGRSSINMPGFLEINSRKSNFSYAFHK